EVYLLLRTDSSRKKAATFDCLPDNESRNTDEQVAEAGQKGYGEGGFAGDAEKVADYEVTALLHPELAGNSKGGIFDRHGHALENKRVQQGRVRAERPKCDKNLAGAGD